MEYQNVYKGNEPYLFISYAHKDSARVLPLIQGLRNRGFRLWYDVGTEAGSEWPAHIATQLKKSACVVVFLSENAIESQNCRQELTMSINRKKNPLIIMLEDIDWAAHDDNDWYSGVEMQISTLHQMYYRRHGNAEAFLDALAAYRIIQCARTATANTQEALSAEEYFQKGIECRKAEKWEEAVKWYRKAAEQGHASAQYNLGWCYDNGYGVVRNESEAVKWFYMAAVQNHSEAQFDLGLSCEFGLGISKNKEEAARWYYQAAVQNHVGAQRELGWCFEFGEGISQNIEEAIKWYYKAAEQGDHDAKKRLEELGSFSVH